MNEFFWEVTYTDSSSLRGRTEPGTGDYNKIDRSKLATFELKSDGKTLLKLKLKPNSRLVYRKRNWQDFMTGKLLGHIYIVEDKKQLSLIRRILQSITGRSFRQVYHVFPDGLKIVKGSWPGGEPELREDEK